VAQEEMQREPVRADVVLEEKSKSEKPTETPSEKVEPVPEQQAQILLENPIATSEPSSEDQPEKIIKPEKQSIAGKTSPESQQLEKQMPVTVVEQQDNPLNVDSPSSQPQSQPQSREEKLAEKVQQQGIQLKSVPTAVVRKETSESKEAPKTPFEKIERVLVPREQDQSPLQSEAKSDFWDNLIEGWNSFWGAVADFFIGIGTSISSFF